MRRTLTLGVSFLLALAVLAASKPAAAEDAGPCTECKLQPYGRFAGLYTCIMSTENMWCSWGGGWSDWCIDTDEGDQCPV